MCIFSHEITAVHDTRIFARIDGYEQYTVYKMGSASIGSLR